MRSFRPGFLIFFLTLVSCQFFDTEKVSSEDILEEELKSINWNDVDSYPLFDQCDETSEKAEQRNCFTNILSTALYKNIEREELITSREIRDTISINFKVDKAGKILVVEMKIDSLLRADFPNLENSILSVLDSVQPVAPAYKRGIPVETRFNLPLIIKSD